MDCAPHVKEVHKDWQEFVRKQMGHEPWLTVYDSSKDDHGRTIDVFSALIPSVKEDTVLQDSSWDKSEGFGRPDYHRTEGGIAYQRFGTDDGFEPFLHVRDFAGVRERLLEPSEEFRLFYNLYHDVANRKYVKFNRSGEPEDVVLLEANRMRVSLQYVKWYLTVKGMSLAVFFEITKQTPTSDRDFWGDTEVVREGKIGYQLSSRDIIKHRIERLTGKKMIPGIDVEKATQIYRSNAQHSEFVIGHDDDGNPVTHTCNPRELSNYAGPVALDYYSLVFFKREVLRKYYDHAKRYTVSDKSIQCHGFWRLRLVSVNHQGLVVAFLGDLGRHLPFQEQVHWKLHNVPPVEIDVDKATLSADLEFKDAVEYLNEKWERQFGWPLFKPLNTGDEHNFNALRVPVSNEQGEFDQQVLAMTKILVDSLNEAELQKLLPDKVEGERGIKKLERLLTTSGLTNHQQHILFLKGLYELRSTGAGHRKSDSYDKVAARFGIGDKSLQQVFEDILRQATDLMIYLGEEVVSLAQKP